jgi:phosphoglycerate kinase
MWLSLETWQFSCFKRNMKIKSITKANDLHGKKVLYRADFNVPIKNGQIKDEYKIMQHLPTLHYLIQKGCKIVVVSHLGRPKSMAEKEKYTLEPIAKRLGKLLGKNIPLAVDIIGFETGTAVGRMQAGDLVMLENVRFIEGELKDSKLFAKRLAKLADLYVNDAFAVSHRAEASVSAIKSYLPSYAGLLLEKEIESLHKALNPKKPLIAVIGGSKISTKVPLIKTLTKKADKVLVGGAMANNFFAAHGLEIGKSLVDKESIAYAKKFKNKNIILPVDVVVSSHKNGGDARVKKIMEVGRADYIFDIGPQTIKLFSSYIKSANTIIWNGPLGMFELKQFRAGTFSIAHVIASRSTGKAFGVVGGGETVEALEMTSMKEYVDWVSTGGGAMLSYLGGENMPGLKGLVSK